MMMSNSRVKFEDGAVWIDDKKRQILAGVMHYFRVPRAAWRDRMQKAVDLGLNCIETYMCANLHEPKEGQFCFEGQLDIHAYIKLAEELGLYVIVRPGPYICSEWDNGGLPFWLMTKPQIEFRRDNAVYFDYLQRYFQRVFAILSPLQIDRNGPVIAIGLENEYGSYSHDLTYLRKQLDLFRKNGVTVPVFTSDGGMNPLLATAGISECPMTLNFGSNARKYFDNGKKLFPNDPEFCMEFWCEWFDHWGEPGVIPRPPEETAAEAEAILKDGGSINIYAFCGGTNFGFMAGANGLPGTAYAPTVTSYHFYGLLDEDGTPTKKYALFQPILQRYNPHAKIKAPAISTTTRFHGSFPLTQSASLFDNLNALSTVQKSVSPHTMEQCGQDYGFLLYRTTLPGNVTASLSLEEVHDRAQIFIDGTLLATFSRNDASLKTEPIQLPPDGARLDILVENFGRINYGAKVGKDFKGIIGEVMLHTQCRLGWEHWPLPLTDLSGLGFEKFRWGRNQPMFHRAEFDVEEPGDCFLDFPGSCGCAFVNRFNLGRYWNIGPQKKLYVPGSLLKRGKNELILFETEALLDSRVHFSETRV
ncbi:MAG: beta-galactosidase [Victivallaceae bacterium]|nr:beta-galactosidase [Victivallaceae bacterium]